MPYGSPEPEAAQSRSYCQRCSNLPQDIMAVLEMHCLQLRRRAERVEKQTSQLTSPETEPAGKR
jgi:hypothetical protein